MVTIAKKIDQDFDYEGLCRDIIEKSKDAINQKKVLTHSILLYTSRHGHLAKLLDDEYLYRSLDEASGRYLNIYHAKSEIQNNRNTRALGFMTSCDMNIYQDQNEYNTFIERFRDEYNINSKIHNPVLFFFTSNDSENFDNTYTVILKGNNPDDYYNELIEIITTVTNAINEVLDENIENQNEILNLAINNIDTFKIKRVVKRATNSSIFQILGFLKPA